MLSLNATWAQLLEDAGAQLSRRQQEIRRRVHAQGQAPKRGPTPVHLLHRDWLRASLRHLGEATRPAVSPHALHLLVDRYPADAPDSRVAHDVRHRLRAQVKGHTPAQARRVVRQALTMHHANQAQHRQHAGHLGR